MNKTIQNKKSWSTPQIVAISSAKQAAIGTSTVNLDLNVGDSQSFVS